MRKTFIGISVLAILVLAGCQGDNNQTTTGTTKNTKSSNAMVEEDNAELEGTIRPDDAAADLVSLPNAYDFSNYNSESLETLNYKIKSSDLLAVCDEVESSLKAVGWERSTEGMNSESDSTNIQRSFANSTHKLIESCSLTDGVPSIALMKNLKK